eukprot:scpid102454/ scgid23164/ 
MQDPVIDALDALEKFNLANEDALIALEDLLHIIGRMKLDLREMVCSANHEQGLRFSIGAAVTIVSIGASVIAGPAALVGLAALPACASSAKAGRQQVEIYRRAVDGVEVIEAESKLMGEALRNCEEAEAREFLERIQRTLEGLEHSLKKKGFGWEAAMKALTHLKTPVEHWALHVRTVKRGEQ